MENNKKREIVFWDCDPGAEELCFMSIEEAVQAWVENNTGFSEPTPDVVVTVYGYARMEPDIFPDGDTILENTLETIDEEEYGDPDGCGVDHVSGDMQEAANRLAEIIKRDYIVWACEVVRTKEVNAAVVLRDLNGSPSPR